MAQIIRYRTGFDRETGQLLRGWAHVAQSLAVIWLTRIDTRVMLLAFGSAVRSFLSEDVTAPTVLALYDELVTAAHRWEPEYRIADLQLVRLTQKGGLGLRHGGTYFPEGRFGNYGVSEGANALAPLAAREAIARRSAA